ncbi:MAG: polysaccharide pyruvyl transferase family protein [Verrucomicrobiota bacterium]
MTWNFLTKPFRSLKARRGPAPPPDRRLLFRDLSQGERTPRSRVIQFYSAAPNIGNYLPVAAIHEMVGQPLDCWNVHDPHIDYDFIHRHYRAAVIGGAGLLHPAFNRFWRDFAERCRLPFVMWGLGGCFPDGSQEPLARESVKRALPRCLACNVRDDVTAETFGLKNAIITACPAVLYVANNFPALPGAQEQVLFADHAELTGPQLSGEIRKHLSQQFRGKFLHTDNEQTPAFGTGDIIRERYQKSRFVVATRLHGAIIAYALRIPYIALAADEKLRALGLHYGNGLVINSLAELPEALGKVESVPRRELAMEGIREFGRKARTLLQLPCWYLLWGGVNDYLSS